MPVAPVTVAVISAKQKKEEAPKLTQSVSLLKADRSAAAPTVPSGATPTATATTTATPTLPLRKPNSLETLLHGWWITLDGKAALWRTDVTNSKNNVKGWVKNPGTKSPMRIGLALDVQAKKKDGMSELVYDIPKQGESWFVPKGKFPVAWWDEARKNT